MSIVFLRYLSMFIKIKFHREKAQYSKNTKFALHKIMFFFDKIKNQPNRKKRLARPQITLNIHKHSGLMEITLYLDAETILRQQEA